MTEIARTESRRCGDHVVRAADQIDAGLLNVGYVEAAPTAGWE